MTRLNGSSCAVGLAVAGSLLAPAVAGAAFPGRNGLIAYSQCTSPPGTPSCAGPFAIMAARERGGASRRIGTGYAPRWSADGRRVVSMSRRPLTLRVTRSDGSGGRDVRVEGLGPGAKAPRFPSWLPNGRDIAFISTSSSSTLPGMYRVALGAAARARAHLLTRVTGAISPDGRRIAYARVDHESSGLVVVIVVARLDGTGARDLLRLPDLGLGHAFPKPARIDWSPDGRRLVFDGDGISVMNADGSGFRTLLPRQVGGGPAWSPDGRRIVFTRFAGTLTPASRSNEVVTMTADGTDLRVVVHDDYGVERPDWQPLPASA